ncbi:integrator complex subunit 4-like [Mya arenaria]|uniref:integrator complex subunit 4-like n=1 Tax=Mya arenaria TaxID=6604 RepID=UPI0022E3B121|nr:integrator complex subunit 4-like [Mya arenaria]
MAALLKKRALAEYSQVIQEEAPKPIKKLRLTQRAAEPEIQLNLHGLSSNDVFQALIKFEHSLPVNSAYLTQIVRTLLDHYGREKEPFVRSKVATLLAKLSIVPGISAESLAEELISLLTTEDSQKAQSHLISALCVIGQSAALNRHLHRQLVEQAQKHLTSGSHTVRRSCLHLIGCLESPDQSNKVDHSSVQKLIESFVGDQDPRVRSSAFEALLKLHDRGLVLEESLYKTACEALTDDYEGVRTVAVHLVWVLSHLYPESCVPVQGSDEVLRLVDDGFVRICIMINDISVNVRTKAASLLGSLHLVSVKFLEQTLDKQLMSNMRRKRTAAERAKEHYTSGVWSSGKKWADDAPKEELDPESVNVINIGACGAFVHGLEDEYSEVRNCTLDSICELASQNPQFAILSQDSIADMFNDEIESVRHNAINSLKKLSQHLEIREDQLEIMVGVLQDFSYVSRESLRDMLCEMKFATKECLNTCVVALLDNLRRYPQDRTSIWKCMHHLGKNCSSLALPLLPDLLCLHPYFDTPEPEMDDPAYISILVLVFNAAAGNHTALPMFQEHTWRHYTYLRDSLPDLVPQLQCEELEKTDGESSKEENSEMAVEFVKSTVEKLSDLGSLDTETATRLLNTAVSDLQQVAKIDSSTSASAECLSLFLKAQILITQLMSQHAYILTGSVTVGNLSVVVEKLLSLTGQLQTLFLGLGTNELALIRQTELKALTFRLCSTLANSQELATQMKAQGVYTNYLSSLQGMLSGEDAPTDQCTSFLLSKLTALKGSQLSNVQNILLSALKLVQPVTCPLTRKVRKAFAVIHEPARVSDNPVKFTAGLTAAIPLIADVENVARLDNVRIRVQYPDTTTTLTKPSPSDLKRHSSLSHRLVSQVLISHGHWSESSTIEVSLVLINDCERLTKFKSQSAHSSEENQSVIELCIPVKVLVSPKPHKR